MALRSLNLEPQKLRYRAMIGTGGVGSGVFFALSGNHTLGREESRGGRFLDRRDYCKLHIIAHYVQTLLGGAFRTIPVGAVGNDDVGRALLAEMAEAGLDIGLMATIEGKPTLYSFCFVYPDGSGGNMTTSDSASSAVDGAAVQKAQAEFSRHRDQGVALAAPEVPLHARRALLKLGTEYGFFRAAAFTTEELTDPAGREMLAGVDLLALNIDEAAAAAELESCEGTDPALIVRESAARLSRINPDMLISITAGSAGSWVWDGSSLTRCPKCEAHVESTAGAGDAHLAGIIVGLTAGLSMPEAQQVGTLVAGLSVTSPHTINNEIDRESLRAFSEHCGVQLAPSVRALLEA